MGDVDLPYRAVADQAASAVDLVVHQARGADGRRRVVEVAAVDAGPDGPLARTLVAWRPEGRRGVVIGGRFARTEAEGDWRRAAERDARLAA